MSPWRYNLSTQFTGAGSVLVDEVVQRHVGQGHLLRVGYDQGPLYVGVQVVVLDLHLERGGQSWLRGRQGLQQARLQLYLPSHWAGGGGGGGLVTQLECLYGQSSVVHHRRGGRHQGGGGAGGGGGRRGRGEGGGGSVKDVDHIWFTGDMGHTCNTIWWFSWGWE